MEPSEEAPVAGLLEAQAKAQAILAEVKKQNLIRPGRGESQIIEGIDVLARSMYGISCD
jgi:hypothetical protein